MSTDKMLMIHGLLSILAAFILLPLHATAAENGTQPSEALSCLLTPVETASAENTNVGLCTPDTQAHLPIDPRSFSILKDSSEIVARVLKENKEKQPKFETEVLEKPLPKEVIDQLYKQWVTKPEGWFKRALKYIPRAVGYTLQFTFSGRTARRIGNLGLSAFETLNFSNSKHFEESAYRLSNSIANPLAAGGDLISDMVTLLQIPKLATKRLSNRMQVCTQNLLEIPEIGPPALHTLNPTMHVSVVVDRSYSTRDPMGGQWMVTNLEENRGAICTPLPLPADQTESAALFRLLCLDSIYHGNAEYEFFSYNCGGYTRDIINWSDSDMTIFPNYGIGSHITIAASSKAEKARRESRKAVPESCDAKLQFYLQAALTAETGTPWSAEQTQFLQRSNPSEDMAMQLVVSAARGKNEENRTAIVKATQGDFFWSFVELPRRATRWNDDLNGKLLPLKPEVRPMLKAMFVGIDEEAKDWLTKKFKIMRHIFHDLEREVENAAVEPQGIPGRDPSIDLP